MVLQGFRDRNRTGSISYSRSEISKVRKKQKRRFDCSKRTPLLFLFVHRGVRKRLVIVPCTRSDHRFCIPTILCGERFPVSTQPGRIQDVCARGHGAVRFLLWWLFLHRRLRSRQRGSLRVSRRSRISSGVALTWLIISKR